MAKKTYTDAERAERAAARSALDAQVKACLTDTAAAAALYERFGGVVRLSNPAEGYSERNAIRLMMQAEDRGIDPLDEEGNERPLVYAGFHAWMDTGRRVRKGQHGAVIYAGGAVSETDEGETRQYMSTAFVFEVSQTEEMSPEEIARYKESRNGTKGGEHDAA